MTHASTVKGLYTYMRWEDSKTVTCRFLYRSRNRQDRFSI